MAKESCIPHSGDIVCIRREYVTLCGGSHSHAAVLDCLEFLTNGKIALLEAGESVEDPWFEASTSAMLSTCVDHYSRTTFKECLDDLQRAAILRVEDGKKGGARRYLLDYKTVIKMIQNGNFFSFDTPVNFDPPPGQNLLPPRSILTPPLVNFDPVLYNAVRTHRNAELPSLPSQEELPFETFAKISLSRYKQAKGTRLDFSRQDKRRFLDWIGEISCTQNEFFLALDRFLQDEYWRKEKFPITAFMKQFEKYLHADTPPAQPVSEPIAAAPEMALALTWRQDQGYGEYIATLAKYGKRITTAAAEQPYPTWCSLTEEQKRKTILDAEYVASIASDPKYIPGPAKHLADKPWDVLRAVVAPRTDRQISDDARFQRQLAMLNKMNPSGVRK